MKKKLFHIILTLTIFLPQHSLQAQGTIIDQVIAIVGDRTILQSDIENQYMQYRAQGYNMPDLKCVIFKDMLEQMLLIDQAKIDSIEISEAEVELQLNQRIEYFISQVGTREELENQFNKTVLEIKEDFRETLRDQMITGRMEIELTGDLKITPSEVKRFYQRIPEDSIPYIDAQVEIQEIVKYPPLGEEAVLEVKERLLELRKRILDGENFETLAILYSEGPSAVNGGEIGFMGKGELDPEYAKAAFSLKKNGISKIVESSFGFHLIQLIDRQDDRVNTRHILMKPRISLESRQKAISKLDSLATVIKQDSIDFSTAAKYFSENRSSAMNGGLMVNPKNNSSKFELEELDTKDYMVARDLEIGELSDPYESEDKDGKTIYKIIRIKSRTNPHKANVQQDYILLQEMALAEKKEKFIQDWVKEKQRDTYIQINSSFMNCDFINKWLTKE